MMPPLISVCVVSYNHQEYITDCLTSVLAQYGEFRLEILLGDDQSTDNTVGILKEVISTYRGDAVIHLFAHKSNLGPSQNYQFLINQAQGDFIAHLDGDDFWLPGKLQAQLQFLRINLDSPACYTNAVVIKDDKSHWGFFSPAQQEVINIDTLLKAGNFLNHSSLLYRSNAKGILLNFPENFIDYRIHLALAQQGDLGFINQVLVVYRINSSTSMIRKMREKVILLYCDAILSTQGVTTTFMFNKSIDQFLKQTIISLLIKRKFSFTKHLIFKIRATCSLSLIKVIFIILPQSFFFEIKYIIKKCVWQNKLHFLQLNNHK